MHVVSSLFGKKIWWRWWGQPTPVPCKAALKVGTNTAQLTDVIVAGPRKWWYVIIKGKICIKNEAKVASWKGGIYRGLCSLASCCLSPMKRNSVFEELRVKRFEVIQEEICCRAPWRCVMLECASESKTKVVYRRRQMVIWRKRWDEWTERGDVHDKKKGPRTEPCGTP